MRLRGKGALKGYKSGVYTSDTGPFERLYDAWVIDTLPEIVAEQLQPFFR